jgi:energy-coupling factor transporter ATP-binding protein EcfA2
VLLLFGLARVIGGRPPGHLSRRQQRRLAMTAALAPAPNALNVRSIQGDNQ